MSGSPPEPPAQGSFTFAPIGVVHSPFAERIDAPRQPTAAAATEATIELFARPGIEHALEDLDGWGHLWVLFVFHRNADRGWRPKVLPPRSDGRRRGLFSTRSPYRPNPIGLSAVELLEVTGRTLRIRGVDILDGSPVLDLKPYVPYADAIPHARTGWVGPRPDPPSHDAARPADPGPRHVVSFGPEAEAQLAFLREEFAIDLAPRLAQTLALGPQPHPYRRIKPIAGGFRLALHDWRATFTLDHEIIRVHRIDSGYRPSQLAQPAPAAPDALAPHRAFAARFGPLRNG